jgi:hypothetical protein
MVDVVVAVAVFVLLRFCSPSPLEESANSSAAIVPNIGIEEPCIVRMDPGASLTELGGKFTTRALERVDPVERVEV